jgi:hypothetical protein
LIHPENNELTVVAVFNADGNVTLVNDLQFWNVPDKLFKDVMLDGNVTEVND